MPRPAKAGRGRKAENLSARGQKISSPKTPPFFARSPKNYLRWNKIDRLFNLLVKYAILDIT